MRKERQNPPSPAAANPRAGREAGRTRLNANMRVMNLSLIVTVCVPCIFGDAPSTKLAQTAKTCKPLHEKRLSLSRKIEVSFLLKAKKAFHEKARRSSTASAPLPGFPLPVSMRCKGLKCSQNTKIVVFLRTVMYDVFAKHDASCKTRRRPLRDGGGFIPGAPYPARVPPVPRATPFRTTSGRLARPYWQGE